MWNTLAGVSEKSTGIGILLWAQDDIRLLPTGSSPSELGPSEMKCESQMPVAPPNLTDPQATLLNQRE